MKKAESGRPSCVLSGQLMLLEQRLPYVAGAVTTSNMHMKSGAVNKVSIHPVGSVLFDRNLCSLRLRWVCVLDARHFAHSDKITGARKLFTLKALHQAIDGFLINKREKTFLILNLAIG